MKSKEVSNTSFAEYCMLKGIAIPNKYRMVKPTLRAGFTSAAKYDRAQPVLDEHAWALSGEWTKRHFHPVMGGSNVLPLSDCLEEMDKTTSCGFPWNRKFHSKNEFLADERASAVLEDYWEVLQCPTNTIVPIWTCTQKVELRSGEKLDYIDASGRHAPKHRTFLASAVEHTASCNRLCLDQNNKFYRGKDRTWSFVGTSKFLLGFDFLYHRLNKHPHAYELDEADYDASLFARALEGQAEIRESFWAPVHRTPENKERMRQIYQAIVHSIIVLENGELVCKHTGNPSGSSNTIVDNTMVLYRLFAYAFIRLFERKNGFYPTYQEFSDNVEAALCGDDNTYTVSMKYADMFTPENVAIEWNAIGVFTKTPCATPRKVEDVRFLSQGFAWDEALGIWMPSPETDRVLGSLMSGSSNNDVRWHYLRACALRLDSYGNKELRDIISGYIAYLDQHHDSRLHGVVQRPGGVSISMSDIRNVWKSDEWIEALYSGSESGCIHNKFAHFKESFALLQGVESNNLEILDLPETKQSKPMPPKPANRKERRLLERAEKAGLSKKQIVSAVAAGKNVAKHAIKTIVGHGDYRPTAFQRVRGRGDYFGDILGGIGKTLGNTVSGVAKAGIRTLTGFGDYRSHGPRSNSLTGRMTPSEAPFTMGAMSVKFAGAAPRVQHREFIGTITAPEQPGGFNTKHYRIQPGLSGKDVLFPWASSVAGCFQQYVLHGCIFEFVSTSSDFAANSALGAVMMSTLYDAGATPLATQEEVDNNEFTTTAKPSVSFYHPIECAGKDSPTIVKYVNKSNSKLSSSDERLDDVGIFQVSTVGLAAVPGTQIGELWCTYDIELLKAALPDLHIGTTFYATTDSGFANSVTTGMVIAPESSLPATINGDFIYMPAGYNGNYMMILTGTCTAGGADWSVSPVIKENADITLLPLFPNINSDTPWVSFLTGVSKTDFPQKCVMAFAFSTIATNASPDDNSIALATNGSVSPAGWSIAIVPLDNDIVAPSSALQRALRKLGLSKAEADALARRPASSEGMSAAAAGPTRSTTEDEKFVDVSDSIYLPKGAYSALLAKISH